MPISDSLVYDPSALRTRLRPAISLVIPQPPRPPPCPQGIVVNVVVSGGPTAGALVAAAPPPPSAVVDACRAAQEAPACPPLPSLSRRSGSVGPAAPTPKTEAIASALLLAPPMLSTAGCGTTVADVPTRASIDPCILCSPPSKRKHAGA